jgi:HPt (histidine-containing phosphotransfer) domain-containing protein
MLGSAGRRKPGRQVEVQEAIAKVRGPRQQHRNAVMTLHAPKPEGATRPYLDIALAERDAAKLRVANPGPPTVNAHELMDRLGGDREFLIELTELFRQDYPRHVQLIRESIDHGDVAGLRQSSHVLKGSLSSLSACQAREFAAHLEEMGTTGNLQGAKAALHDLERELVNTMEALEALCREAGR